ncbi:MAG: ABC transporter permease [Polyangiales bacterium]
MRSLRFLGALVATSLKVSVAHRAAFLMQAVFMALNNLLFFSTWWILFARFDHVGGYRLHDMLLLFGVTASGFGLAVVLCGGTIELARAIADGDLDAFLAQPKNVLVRAIASRSVASGWGDIVSGVALIGFSDPARLRWAPVAIVLTALGFVASACVVHSSAFWLGRVDGLARTFMELIMTFSLYPPPLFGLGLRMVLFTILPAGVIAYLPVELLRAPGLRTLTTAVLGVSVYVALAAWVFQRGLRNYASGSRFGALG